MKNAKSVAGQFFSEQDIAALDVCGSGNINDTWILCLQNKRKYILQRVNDTVFKKPVQVMHNIRLVTNYLHRVNNSRDRVETLRFFAVQPTKKGDDFFWTDDNRLWRLLSFIPQSRTIHAVENSGQARELGKALGTFHRLLGEMDPVDLFDTVPGFHITPKYMEAFAETVVAGQVRGGTKELRYCFEFIETHRKTADLLEKRRNELSSQVIHGDPKITNFLFHQQLDKVISIIDLDTVRPGLLLYDIGDALRSCCNRSGETTSGRETIMFSGDLFSAWLEGYLQEAHFLLTPQDRELIVGATLLLTFELGLRFLSDHLAGDHYFTIKFPGQNLRRAIIQFQLAASIEALYSQLEAKVFAIASRV